MKTLKKPCVVCSKLCLNTFANGMCADCERARIASFAPLWAPTKNEKTWLPERRETDMSATS